MFGGGYDESLGNPYAGVDLLEEHQCEHLDDVRRLFQGVRLLLVGSKCFISASGACTSTSFLLVADVTVTFGTIVQLVTYLEFIVNNLVLFPLTSPSTLVIVATLASYAANVAFESGFN